MNSKKYIFACLLCFGFTCWGVGGTQSASPKSYSVSIKTGQVSSRNAMRVEGTYRDIFDTKAWGLDMGFIWRIYIGTPIKFIWNDGSQGGERVELAVHEMSLSMDGRLSSMVVKINGKKEIHLAEASSLKKTTVDITDYVIPGENTLEASSKDGTNILHGLQSVEVVYYPSASDRTPPLLTVTEPSVERGMKVTRKDKVITVKGRATDESGVYEVLVNDSEARLTASGEFQAEILLGVGENTVRVRATDTKKNTSEMAFSIVREPDISAKAGKQTGDVADLSVGHYYALILAIQDYQDPNVTDLDYPIQDAKRVKELLSRQYTFDDRDVIFLENPDRTTIINSLDQLTQKMTEADSLLIFYAGHGYWDEKLKQGFWLPSNSRSDSRSEWLSNSTVRDYLGGIRAKHILLIADACFSGSIFKTREAFISAPASVQELYKLPSRKAITSGAMKSVPDKSVFVEYLIKRLGENREEFFSAEELFSSMRTAVINNSPNKQTPQYGEIREAGDEGGDFIFVRRLKR